MAHVAVSLGGTGDNCDHATIVSPFSSRLVESVVFAVLTLSQSPPPNTLFLSEALHTICDVYTDNVLVTVPSVAEYQIVVIPSTDASLQTNPTVIQKALIQSVNDSTLAQEIADVSGVVVPGSVSFVQPAQVIDVQHWDISLWYNITCNGTKAQCYLRFTADSVAVRLQMFPSDVAVQISQPIQTPTQTLFTAVVSVHLMNSSILVQTGESMVPLINSVCVTFFPPFVTASPPTVVITPLIADRPSAPALGMDEPCYGHGTLSDNGTCDCDFRWKMIDCSARRCPIGFTASGDVLPFLECSGQGTCNDPYGYCTCNSGFGGDDCSQVLACNLTAAVQCSGHGSCTPDDAYPYSHFSCKCFSGWKGSQCATNVIAATCPMGLGKVGPVWGQVACSGRGNCQCSINACRCNCATGWTGVACDTKDCLRNCSRHGLCFDGECLCRHGWTGAACEASVVCPNECNHRGDCVNGECVCQKHFLGLACEIDACEANGTSTRRIVSISTTTANLGDLVSWRLDSEPTEGPFSPNASALFTVCLSVGVHAIVGDGPLNKVVSLAYTGLKRVNQSDVRTITLSDRGSYVYEFTVESECPGSPVCTNRGVCMHGQCCCAVGYTGDTCEASVTTTFAPSGNCPPCPKYHVCNNGSCVCTRSLAQAGVCDVHACPFNSNACGVCSGHGDCFNGTCVCDLAPRQSAWSDISGWFGADCSRQILCPGACNAALGNGVCNLTIGQCVCSDGFRGLGCEDATCVGSPPCSGRGVCANGTCDCGGEWEGAACEIKRCVGGCQSGQCVNGKCVCAPHWSGDHCQTPDTCPDTMVFSNCTDPMIRSCNDSSTLLQSGNCIPGCTCPPATPLWDPNARKCVRLAACSQTCWGSLSPDPHELQMSVQTTKPVKGNSAVVCANQLFRVCYKAGGALLSSKDSGGLIGHARDYRAPIGLVIYDEHGNRIVADWARSLLESSGRVVGLFGAEGGYALMSVNRFGPMEIRFYVVGPSSTAPIFLGVAKIFAADCEMKSDVQSVPTQCNLPQLNNGQVTCDGLVAGATCHLQCNDGYVLSNPQQADVTCLGTGNWDLRIPTCVGTNAASSCPPSREGEICALLIGNATVGVCQQGVCQPWTPSAFCARSPVLTGNGCGNCAYVCNGANTVCEARCAAKTVAAPTAQCVPNYAGGWWSGLYTGSCASI